jgi:hypothetical protein
MSDMIHAMHAATGADVPSNEEWHYRPIDVDLADAVAGHAEVAGLDAGRLRGRHEDLPQHDRAVMLRDRVVDRLFALRAEHRIAPDLKLAFEAPCRPNSLRYASGRERLERGAGLEAAR